MIYYKIGTNCVDWTQLYILYGEVGLVGDFGKQKNCDAIKTTFTNSYKVVTAWDGKYLIGAGRFVSDRICSGTIEDIGALLKYRRRGVATRIVEELLEDTENMFIHLTSKFDIEELYKKLGFKRHRNAFARYPRHSDYLEDL